MQRASIYKSFFGGAAMQYNPTGPDHVKESLLSSIHSLIPRKKEFFIDPDTSFPGRKKYHLFRPCFLLCVPHLKMLIQR